MILVKNGMTNINDILVPSRIFGRMSSSTGNSVILVFASFQQQPKLLYNSTTFEGNIHWGREVIGKGL